MGLVDVYKGVFTPLFTSKNFIASQKMFLRNRRNSPMWKYTPSPCFTERNVAAKMVFDSVNEILSPFESWQIVVATGAATILLLKISTFLAGQ